MRKTSTALICSLLFVSCIPQPKPIGWILLQTSSNLPPLSHSGFAYDTKSSEAVVFGGIFKDKWSDETWIWNGNNWRKANTSTSPSAREKTAMAYDEARDRTVLFGGVMDETVFDDTWEWNSRNWQLMSPTHKPPARCCHALAYDSMQKKVVLYGGWNAATGEFFSDTWMWDGKDWTEMTCCNIPQTAAHTLVNFSDRTRVVAVPSTEFVNTWQWDGEKWSEITIHPNPSRADGRSAYDNKNRRIVFFGGIRNGTFLNDIWVFDGQTWNLLNLPTQPPARYGHILFYDTTRRTVILFGGTESAGLLGDTWEHNLPEDLSGLFSKTTATP
jgi:N-acetylneuraminic acid mutarotase